LAESLPSPGRTSTLSSRLLDEPLSSWFLLALEYFLWKRKKWELGNGIRSSCSVKVTGLRHLHYR
jgi:hypothetical protein